MAPGSNVPLSSLITGPLQMPIRPSVHSAAMLPGWQSTSVVQCSPSQTPLSQRPGPVGGCSVVVVVSGTSVVVLGSTVVDVEDEDDDDVVVTTIDVEVVVD